MLWMLNLGQSGRYRSLLSNIKGWHVSHHSSQIFPTLMGPLAGGLVTAWGFLLLQAIFGANPDLFSLAQCGAPENPRLSAKRYAFGSICKNSPAINLSNSIWGSHNFLHSDKLLFISNVPEGNWPIAYFNCQCHYAEPGGKTQIQPGDFSELDPRKTDH